MMNAGFTTNDTSLADAASKCGFIDFNWQQTITAYPTPSNLAYCTDNIEPYGNCMFANYQPNVPLVAPYTDPVPGGYTYQHFVDDSYPFYCAVTGPAGATCPRGPNFLLFQDIPADLAMNPIYNTLPPGTKPTGVFMAFTTTLVGVLPGYVPGPALFQWTWISTFDGSVGFVSVTKNSTPADPGSGTGGITITSINGVQLPTAVPASQVATTASGLAYSRVSQTFNGTVTVRNISSTVITGPFQILFFGMPANVTLVNATGNLSGTPYLTVPGVATLPSGRSVTVSVEFKNPSNVTINSTPVIYAGSIN
jgi:hypothetical protein